VVDSVENEHQAAWVDTTPAIIINIQRQPGTNIIGVVDTVTTLLPHIKDSLPAGVETERSDGPYNDDSRVRRGRGI